MPLSEILREAVICNASDIYLTVEQHIFFRIYGEVFKIGNKLTSTDLKKILEKILSDRLRRKLEKKLTVDFSYFDIEISRRFRINVFYQRKLPAIVIRIILDTIPTMDKLGVPNVLRKFFYYKQGLILITGQTGSGKSTTIAAFLNELCETRACHLLTLEDPIEYEFSMKNSFVSQREFGEDFLSFADAVRTSLREMPDVLLVGEIRDAETMHAALEASAAGILVLATLHTRSAAETVMRVETMFPLVQRDAIRDLFADEFTAIISQQLVKTSRGRQCAAEVLIATPASRSLIRQGKYLQLQNVMLSGRELGMQTMEFALKAIGYEKV